jgi:tetratricopeptide (TPR) repeat protein
VQGLPISIVLSLICRAQKLSQSSVGLLLSSVATLSLVCGSYAQGQSKTPPPRDFAALSVKADTARDAGRLDDAVVLYKKALALRPGWAEGWWSLGTIQYDRSAYAEAARAFQKVVALNPKNGTAHAMLGLCEFELGHDDVALKHIEESKTIGVANDPQLQQVVLYHEAVLFQRGGKFEGARETLEQLCLQGVQSDEIANTLGMVLLRERGRNPPTAGSPEADIVVRVGRSGCLAGKKQYEDARKDFSDVVNEHPDFPNIHYAYGLFLLEVHDLDAAVSEFEQEIKNQPDHVFARLQIAAARYKVNSAAGVPYAEQAVKLAPEIPLGHYLLGLLLLDTDDYQKAIPELETARKAFPREAKLYFALGSAYSRAGRMQDAARARATFERLKKETTKDSNTAEFGARLPQ